MNNYYGRQLTFYRLVFLVLTAVISQQVNARSYDYNSAAFNAFISTGLSSVKANELVYGQPAKYPVDYKLSQLIWDSRNVSTIFTGFNISKRGYTLAIDAKFAVDEGKGVMDDYDWIDIGNDWSDWSHHEDTDITDFAGIDINAAYNFFAKNKNKLSLVAGYRYETWAWESRGGSYIYSTTGILRDNIGNFTTGQSVITYKQEFNIPYFGLKYESVLDRWKVNVQYDYSALVDVSAVDYHVLRDLIFKDNFAKGKMNAYKIGVGYEISKNFDLNIRYDVTKFDEVRGSTVYFDSTTGAATGYCLNCAGADNSNETWSIGASFRY